MHLYYDRSGKSQSMDEKTHFFNFLNDINREIYGEEKLFRPYEGKEITLVLFDLKSGFKFEDKGHPNEQITWLTKGKMSFYAKDQKDILFEN